jgi:hypothetical protein
MTHVSGHDWSANTWQNKLIIGGTLVAVFVVLPLGWTLYSNHRSHTAELRHSQAALERAEGGWSKPYGETSCQDFAFSMTEAQRLVAADSILGGDWYADPPAATGGGQGYPNPPSWLVAQFDDAISKACLSTPGASLDETANDVIADQHAHFRLENG